MNTPHALLFGCALMTAGSIVAANATPSQAAHVTVQVASQTSKESQVDGILSSVTDQLWDQTDVYWHHGDYPRICDLDRVIVQADPHFVDCYSTGGWLMESLGRLSDAEAFYQAGISNNPDSSYAYYSLGMFYFNTLKDYPAATATFRQDSTTAGANDKDLKMLAHSYERIGQLQNAVDTWQTIKKKWPDSPAIQVNLNRVLAKLAASKPAQAGQ